MNPDDVAGFFERGNKIWEVNREMVLLLAGGRALLMQLAHPKVAAGVADHSRFQQDPFARLRRTMSAMWSIVFDPQLQARASLERVELRHKAFGASFPSANRRKAALLMTPLNRICCSGCTLR